MSSPPRFAGALPPETALYALGGALAALALVQPAFVDVRPAAAVLQVGLPLVLSGVPVYAALVVRRGDRRAERATAVAWGALSLAGIGEAVTLTITAVRTLEGGGSPDALFTQVLALTAGAAVGTPVGYHYDSLIVYRRKLEAENEVTRRLNQRLQVINRVLRHNVRTELQLLTGHLDAVLADDAAGTVDVEASAATCRASVDRLERIVEKTRMVEDLEVDGERVAVDLVPVLRAHVRRQRERHPDLTITTSLPPAAVVAAHPLIETAVVEPVANAVAHNDHDDLEVSVTAHAAEDDDRVTVVVADTGSGIPDHEIAALERSVETPLEHASSIGLWFLRWVVEASGGTVAFRDDEPTGTVVRLRLPAAEDAAVEGSGRGRSVDPPGAPAN